MDDPQLWALFRAVAADPAAWQPLVVALEPRLTNYARRQPIGRLRDSEDSPREIVTRVLARLHANNFSAIQKLCAQPEPPTLQAWLRVIVRCSAIDLMRESPEYDRGNTERAPRWVSLETLSSGVSALDPDTLAEKRRAVAAFVRGAVERVRSERASHGEHALATLALEWKINRIHVRRLIARGERYLEVLSAIFEGHSYPEIASRLGITRREVELSVRYIEELLAARGFAG